MVEFGLVLFAFFLLALIALDLIMVISLLRPGDERKQIIVWKTSTYTLLVAVLGLVIDVVESIIRTEAMMVNPFVKLGVIAMIYCILLLYFKKKYGD